MSRTVAAGIEQNHDDNGICWPEAMAPWQAAVCVINPKKDAAVAEAAESLYRELNAAGVETVLDDRGLRPGAMFADMELIGIPHRIVVSERGIAPGTFEYSHRRASEAENVLIAVDPVAVFFREHAADRRSLYRTEEEAGESQRHELANIGVNHCWQRRHR